MRVYCSHLVGTFYRTIRLVENGIKPVYVFDGKPPEMKSGELLKRAERREEAQKGLQEAEESGKMLADRYFRCDRCISSKSLEL